MAEVLSQGEIDALLSALSSGELEPEQLAKQEEHKVKKYDFRSPQKFSKDHIRTLELVHDNYARIISSYLSAHLRTNVKVKIMSVQQITYEEFIHSVPNPTILTAFNMSPLSGSILFEANPEFVFKVLDILLGGSGVKEFKMREFTDIDKNIIRNVNDGLISNLKLAWEDILDVVDPEIESLETNPALNQTLAPNEPVALITFSVDMVDSNSFINICIPYLSIEKVLDKLVVQYWFKESDDAFKEDSREKIKDRLNIVDVQIKTLLGKCSLTVEDFLRLNVGDVITLDQKTSEPVEILIGEQAHYYGKVGIIGKNKGVQILDIKDVENYG
ncbi:flagellar motor switch protein FliM [Haloimpatiens massiliensis]|uniref:flagellar motor switch protein FliM n=1 Tax=Haloimpatiens massiliensis TaxID=1658110 RepID=UPI000C835DE6|nr:flagellar motor switch protein FliM [Haloimpatiens massiliensis]